MAKSKYQIELEEFKDQVREIAENHRDPDNSVCIDRFLSDLDLQVPTVTLKVTLEISGIPEDWETSKFNPDSWRSYEYSIEDIITENVTESLWETLDDQVRGNTDSISVLNVKISEKK